MEEKAEEKKNSIEEKEEEESNDIGEVEEEQEKTNLRQLFDKFFTKQKMAILHYSMSSIALISFIFYVVCTYEISLFKYMNYFDILVLISFFAYYYIEITLSHHRILYIFSLNSFKQFII